jgi:hypothetical protein
VQISLKQHELFTRDGDDLHCEIPISFVDAALGGELEVPTLDGRVKLKIPEGTQTGKLFRLRGKGVAPVRGGAAGYLDAHTILQYGEAPDDRDARQYLRHPRRNASGGHAETAGQGRLPLLIGRVGEIGTHSLGRGIKLGRRGEHVTSGSHADPDLGGPDLKSIGSDPHQLKRVGTRRQGSQDNESPAQEIGLLDPVEFEPFHPARHTGNLDPDTAGGPPYLADRPGRVAKGVEDQSTIS